MTTEQQKESQRKRTRRSRAKKRQEESDRFETAKQQTSEEKYEAARLQTRKEWNLIYMGETAVGIDCVTADEEMQTARMFARASAQPDVQDGEDLTSFCKRIWTKWIKLGESALRREDFARPGPWFEYHSMHKGSPLLSLDTQKFDCRMLYHPSGKFEEVWSSTDELKTKPLAVAEIIRGG